MKTYIANPDLRVFHIDHESYIIYRGLTGKEQRPFLRIGASRSVPPELKTLTEWVAIPDSVIGDPTLERSHFGNLNGDQTYFIGDPEWVGYYKDFVDHPSQPTRQYIPDEPIVREEGTVLYFYKDGNLTIRAGKKEIFNLNRRRTSDRHYVVRTQRARRIFIHNPLRIVGNELRNDGFMVCNGVVYLFSSGRIGILSPGPNWFEDLAVHGIDPDLVQSVFASDFDEGSLRYLQRMRLLSKSVHVTTTARDTMLKGMRLLLGSEVNEAAVEGVDEATGGTFNMLGIKVTRASGRNKAAIRLELPDGSQLELEQERLVWRVVDDRQGKTILEGVPHRLFPKSPLSCVELIDRYVPNSLESQQEFLRAGEYTFIGHLRGVLRKIDAKSVPPAATINAMQSAQRRLQQDMSPLFGFLLHNASVIMRSLEAELAEHAPPALEQCMRIVHRFALRVALRRYLPGILVDVRSTPVGMQPLYKIASTLTRNNLAAARSTRREIETELAGRDGAYYQSELERLRVLLMELGLTTDRRPQTAQAPQASEQSSQAATETAARVVVDEKMPFAERMRLRALKRAARRNRIIAAAAVLFVLVAAGAIWWLSRAGVISLPFTDVAAATTGADATTNADATTDAAATDTNAGADANTDSATTSQGATAAVVEEPPTPRPEEAAEQVIIRETPTGILITLADVVRLTNQIALLNGYHELGDFDSGAADPDFIYPGNLLTFPDESEHSVVPDDNIWNLTADYIEDWLAVRYGRYQTLINTDISTATARDQFIETLRALEEGSYSENFSALIVDTIEAATKGFN